MSLTLAEGVKESNLSMTLSPSVVLLLTLHKNVMSRRVYYQKTATRKKQQSRLQYSEFQTSHTINIMLSSPAPSIFICSYKVRIFFLFECLYYNFFRHFHLCQNKYFEAGKHVQAILSSSVKSIHRVQGLTCVL